MSCFHNWATFPLGVLHHLKWRALLGGNPSSTWTQPGMTHQAPGWTPSTHPSPMPMVPAAPMADTHATVVMTIGTMATTTHSAPSLHRAWEAGVLAVLGSQWAATRLVGHAIAMGYAWRGVMGDATINGYPGCAGPSPCCGQGLSCCSIAVCSHNGTA